MAKKKSSVPTPKLNKPSPKKFSNVSTQITNNPIAASPAKPTAEDLELLKRRRQEDDDRINKELQDPKKKLEDDAKTNVRKFIELALTRFKLAAEATASTRKESLEDLQFWSGEQWSPEIKGRRELDQRPCLTINRIKQFTRIVTNEQRQQRPAIQVNPVGDGADTDTAQIFQGMCRHIEVNSDAEVAYDEGGEYQVVCGFGYWRVLPEYIPGTFDQELKIKRIQNPFCVYFDPGCIEHDYSDANWCFIVEDVPRAEYQDRYPDAQVVSLSDMSSIGDHAKDWVTREYMRVAEYFYVENEKKTLYEFPDGTVGHTEDAPPDVDLTKLRSREELVRVVKWAKISALDALEGGPEAEHKLETIYIPVIPCLGDDKIIDGKHYTAGMVRDARDPQRMNNYWISAATETIALAPKAPFVVAAGQIEDYEEQWRQANTRNFAYLVYKPTDVNGQAVPAPQRQTAEPPIQAIAAMIRQADTDLKGTVGLYDASIGEPTPDESAKAALVRQKQGNIATLNFSDNQARAIRHTGRILIDWIPKKYDAIRIQRIIKPDQSVDTVGIYNSKTTGHSPEEALQLAQQMNSEIQRVFDIGVGRYDVTVSVGPSYQSKRQEAVASMMNLVSSYPQLMQAAGDLLIENMDWPGAQAIAARLKKTLPPNLLDSNSADPQIRLAALQNQMQVLMGQHTALVQQLEQATDIIKTKKMDLDSKERIATLHDQVQVLIAQAKINADSGMKALDGQLKLIQQRLDHMHDIRSMHTEAALNPPIPENPPPVAPTQGA